MTTLLERLVLLGLGGAVMAQDAVREAIDEMVKRGDVSREEAGGVMRDMEERGRKARDEITSTVREETRKMIDRLDLVTKEDLHRIQQRLDVIEERLSG